MGKPWLDQEIQTINTDSAIFDAELLLQMVIIIKQKKYYLQQKCRC